MQDLENEQRKWQMVDGQQVRTPYWTVVLQSSPSTFTSNICLLVVMTPKLHLSVSMPFIINVFGLAFYGVGLNSMGAGIGLTFGAINIGRGYGWRIIKERLLNRWKRHDRTIHLVDAFEWSPEYFSHMVSRFFSKQSFHRRGSQVPVVITENSDFGDLNTLIKVAANHLGFSSNLQSTYRVSYIATVTEKGEEIARLGSPLHQMIRKVSEYASRGSTVLAVDIRKMDKYYGGSFLMKARHKEYLELIKP
ncbi:hypothetical protein B9Z55_013980 [Caenorhabditis nigoni]|uniref:Uncharacterized protein n=1 Tax=Caenorhabditis nigoni TaxID=1611254 RepID=A0A2G5U410_9PELO|nr:hypothetical protein B9Z55_013980 [Caenorhabditis nigoni]